MKILLTGVAGFIGSNLADKLLEAGHEVIGMDNFITGKMENIEHLHLKHPKFLFQEFDILGLAQWQTRLKVETVIHLAALGSVPRSVADPLLSFAYNVCGTQVVFEWCRNQKVRRVLYASSSSIYGNPNPVQTKTEDLRLEPISPYAATKAANEMLANGYAHAYGMSFTGLRFFNVFGQRQRADSEYAAAFPKFCNALICGKPITIFGDGQQTRTFTPIKFVCDSIDMLLRAPAPPAHEVFNITDERFSTSVETLAHGIADALDKHLAVEHQPERTGDVRSSIGSGEKLFEYLDHHLMGIPACSFRDELKKACVWYAGQC